MNSTVLSTRSPDPSAGGALHNFSSTSPLQALSPCNDAFFQAKHPLLGGKSTKRKVQNRRERECSLLLGLLQWPMSKVGPGGADVPPHPRLPPKPSISARVGKAARSLPPSRSPRHSRTDGHESRQPQPNPLRSPALWKDKEPSLLCQ